MLRFVWDLSMAEDVNEFRQRHDLIPVTTTKVKSTIRPGLQGNIEHEQKRTGCNLRWCDAVVRRMASSHKIVVVSKDSREVNAYRIRTFRFILPGDFQSQLDFTFFWTDRGQWEGRNHEVHAR